MSGAWEGERWRRWVSVFERAKVGTGAGTAVEEGLLKFLLEDGKRGQALTTPPPLKLGWCVKCK